MSMHARIHIQPRAGVEPTPAQFGGQICHRQFRRAPESTALDGPGIQLLRFQILRLGGPFDAIRLKIGPPAPGRV